METWRCITVYGNDKWFAGSKVDQRNDSSEADEIRQEADSDVHNEKNDLWEMYVAGQVMARECC